MRNRLTPLLLLVVVALVALYSRHSVSRPSDRNGPKKPGATAIAPPIESISHTNRGRKTAQPGDFDFYLLNLSWSPEFCSTHPGKPECGAHPAFVLHGLWPQNNDGTYPEHCSTAPGPHDPAVYQDIYPDGGLLDHEWQTHGTCSGMQADDYLNLARKAVHQVTVPNSLAKLSDQVSRTPDSILSDFNESNPSYPRESLALSCGNNLLTAVEVCLSKSLMPIACSGVRSCRANSVRILPPAGVP